MCIRDRVVGDDDAAFAAGVDLEEVEAEAAHPAEEAEVLALSLIHISEPTRPY